MNRLFLSWRRGCKATAALILTLGAWPLVHAHAQVRALTLGIDMNCPYGLAG